MQNNDISNRAPEHFENIIYSFRFSLKLSLTLKMINIYKFYLGDLNWTIPSFYESEQLVWRVSRPTWKVTSLTSLEIFFFLTYVSFGWWKRISSTLGKYAVLFSKPMAGRSQELFAFSMGRHKIIWHNLVSWHSLGFCVVECFGPLQDFQLHSIVQEV